MAPPADSCKVRVNLALAIERMGDAEAAAREGARAATLFRDAAAVVDTAPATCFEDGSPGNSDGEGSRLEAAVARLASKLTTNEAEPEQPAERPAPEADSAAEDRQQRLQESAQDALRDRADGGELDEYLGGPDSVPLVDRPW